MKNYNFDGHKIFYHFDRLDQFLSKGDCSPIYIEISPIGRCNHRCIFCAYDYIGYPSRKLETKRLLKIIKELAKCGLKSVLFSGEGEPLLHPDIDKFIITAKENKIDVGVYTNGQLFKKGLAEKILPSLTFIRFSFNGGNRENYSYIHRVRVDIFNKVVENIRNVLEIKRKNNLDLDVGVQFVLLPENLEYLIGAVKLQKENGVDYFAIKPFVQQSDKQFYKTEKRLTLYEIDNLLTKAEGYSNENFKVIARKESFETYGKRNYLHCLGTSFITVLNSAGDVSTCLPYWDKKEFVFGNIYENGFKEIWHSKRRKKIKEYLENKLETTTCSPNCRCNAINNFLWEIKKPTIRHVNFI